MDAPGDGGNGPAGAGGRGRAALRHSRAGAIRAAAPSNLSATHNGGAVTATWVPPSNATKYHITYSTDNMNSWSGPTCGMNCSAAGTETEASFTITGADPAKTYVVSLRAGNAHGWSAWVNSAPAAPPNPPPAAPSAVTVARADGELTASWNAVTDATKYHITYTSDGGNAWTAASDNHSENSITITDVDNFKTYIVGVRAGKATGWRGWRGWRNSDAVLPMTPCRRTRHPRFGASGSATNQ